MIFDIFWIICLLYSLGSMIFFGVTFGDVKNNTTYPCYNEGIIKDINIHIKLLFIFGMFVSANSCFLCIIAFTDSKKKICTIIYVFLSMIYFIVDLVIFFGNFSRIKPCIINAQYLMVWNILIIIPLPTMIVLIFIFGLIMLCF